LNPKKFVDPRIDWLKFLVIQVKDLLAKGGEGMSESMLNRIRMVSLRVRDLKAAECWYIEKLGLLVLWRNESTVGIQINGSNGTVLVLVEAADPARFEREKVLHFTTSDIEAAFEKLKASGVPHLEQIQSTGSTSVFCYLDYSNQPTMIWSELSPLERADEISELLSRYIPVLA
jgi:catechol 2,3-dioxygenase-like lactoylglutathione lyase family enzyme